MSETTHAASSANDSTRTDRLITRLAESRLGRFVMRWRRLMPVASFALGVGSYFLVQRQNALAQWLMVLMLLGWLALLFEGLLHRVLARLVGERLPQTLVRFAAQGLHQETLFFVLPFFLASTTWSSPQALFTGLLIAAAVASAIDPLYYDGIAGRRWLFLAYHAFAMFVAVLAAGPIIGSMTTGASIGLAAVVMAVCALPSFNAVIRTPHWSRWLLMIGLSLALGAGAWGLRFWIPPATLNVTHMAITTRMDADQRDPGVNRGQFAVAGLQSDGLYAFTAIKAPRGLHQQILHVWSHEGRVVDRIPLQIIGGTRKGGYRAWSHKLSLGADSTGRWRVAVVTDDGQLIGAEHFVIGETDTLSWAGRLDELADRMREWFQS